MSIHKTRDWAHLVFEVIPPIWPRLFDTALFFEDRLLHHGTKHAECHRDTVIIIAVDADALLKFNYRLAVYLKAVIQFFCFDAKLGFMRHKSEHGPDGLAMDIPS